MHDNATLRFVREAAPQRNCFQLGSLPSRFMVELRRKLDAERESGYKLMLEGCHRTRSHGLEKPNTPRLVRWYVEGNQTTTVARCFFQRSGFPLVY